jgi:hypothetical protein
LPTPARSLALPSPAIWASVTDRDEAGPAPGCFAYSPSRRAYACVGWVAPDEDENADELGYVDVVGGRADAPVVEQHLSWSRRRGEVSREAVAQRLAALGFTGVAPQRERLPPGRWREIDGFAIRYTVRLHEGGASYEYFGQLDLRCADGRERHVEVRRRGLELGEHAAASWAPGSGTVALSVHGVDGGEGHDDHWLNTVVLDTEAICRGAEGVVGPIEGRMVGP